MKKVGRSSLIIILILLGVGFVVLGAVLFMYNRGWTAVVFGATAILFGMATVASAWVSQEVYA